MLGEGGNPHIVLILLLQKSPEISVCSKVFFFLCISTFLCTLRKITFTAKKVKLPFSNFSVFKIQKVLPNKSMYEFYSRFYIGAGVQYEMSY